jgi:hypothetical protein
MGVRIIITLVCTAALACSKAGGEGIQDASIDALDASTSDSGATEGTPFCTQSGVPYGGSAGGVCTLSADEYCSDNYLHHAICDCTADGGVVGSCVCELLEPADNYIQSTTVTFDSCPSCPSASQSWAICGWPQPAPWTFNCGSMKCAAGSESCSVTQTGCGASAPKYSCTPLPAACAPDAAPSDCACLGSSLGNGCSCSADGVGNLSVTCCAGDAGGPPIGDGSIDSGD